MTNFVELELSPQQVTILEPVIRVEPRRPVLFISTAAPQWNREKGNVTWRWQVRVLSWELATRVLKIIDG